MSKRFLLNAAAAVAIICAPASALAQAAPAVPAAPTAVDPTVSPKYGAWGFNLAGRDLATNPGDDFYRHAVGKYLDTLVISPEKIGSGPWDVLGDLSEARLKTLIADLGARQDLKAGSEESKIAILYSTFMDKARIDALDAKPLQPALARIRAVRTHEDMATLMARPGFGAAVFGTYVGDDDKNPGKNAVFLAVADLGLPDRDYYLTEQFKTEKAAYQTYVAQTLDRIGWPDAPRAAAEIVAFETRIAEASWARADQRDPVKMYHPMTVAELKAFAPQFPWSASLAASGMSRVDRLVVGTDTAVPKVAAIYRETPLTVLKAWQAFRTTYDASPYLSERFVTARFEFRKLLTGATEQQPRWKRGVYHVEEGIGFAVGRAYVDRYFTADAKAKMDVLVGNLLAAMKVRIQRLDWMTPETKAKALEKLARFDVKIGYPSKWQDYSSLNPVAGDLYGNVERISRYEWNRQLAKIGEPVDRTEWGMTPQTINAYYNPTRNEIVFPAAILDAPFFAADADPAVNYGAIGGVIGHEISHGFDDQGRQYDGTGALTDWWKPEDARKFEAQAEKLGKQYEAVEILPGAKINGKLTMGENIGDLGGLTLAYEAYKISLGGKPSPVIDGTTGEQRVFYGWAQAWASKYREPFVRQILVSDPHAPDQARGGLTVRNVDGWYEAFGVKEGDKAWLRPEDRVRIW